MDFTNDRFRLDGKVAIVTGAGGRGNNIGRAYAIGLANAGAAVIAADIVKEGAEAVAHEIIAAGGKALAVQVDITNEASVATMVADAQATFGGVDILVNNAALMVEIVATPAMQTTTEQWHRALNVNLLGALHCIKAVVPLMEARGGGRIVNQVTAGAFPAKTVYGVTKIALHGLTTTLAAELGPKNITVNGIAPGITMSDAGAALTPGTESEFTKVVNLMCAYRMRGTPDELVGPLLMLVSDAGGWMSGQTLNVDGGFVLRN